MSPYSQTEKVNFYKAIQAKDKRYDGQFFTAVLSTGIYCRPVCPARTPKQENCQFFPSAPAAEAAGFRPCLRCRPELSPSFAAWHGTENSVNKALKLINEGILNEGSVDELADKVGLGSRHLRRLFDQYLGTSPLQVAHTRRLLLAKQLLHETSLSLTQIAYAAGFQSLRRFNDAFLKSYKQSPGKFRRIRKAKSDKNMISLDLSYHAPLDWSATLVYLSNRNMPGIDYITEKKEYLRNFNINGQTGYLSIKPHKNKDALTCEIHLSDVKLLPTIISRIKHLFDLDTNIPVIEKHLRSDPFMASCIDKTAFFRLMGCWDPYELVIRTVLGQQVSVKAANTLMKRIIDKFGTPAKNMPDQINILFPRPEILKDVNLSNMGLTTSRIRTIQAVSEAFTDNPELVTSYHTSQDIHENLGCLFGIGEWTVNYVAMRVCHETDAFPAADLGLQNAFRVGEDRPTKKQLEERSEIWRPWRAYAAMQLWASLGNTG